MEKRIVVCQKWEESERGWSTRPDGYSLHLTEKDCAEFIKKYWVGMPDSVPDEYSRPYQSFYSTEVSEKVFEEVKNSKNGIWCFGDYPERPKKQKFTLYSD